MARGYRSRWFVLENGVLSYYRNQDEEGKASRGSISMSVAVLMPSADEKALKFELSNKLGKSYPSFWLKATRESSCGPQSLADGIQTLRRPLAGLMRCVKVSRPPARHRRLLALDLAGRSTPRQPTVAARPTPRAMTRPIPRDLATVMGPSSETTRRSGTRSARPRAQTTLSLLRRRPRPRSSSLSNSSTRSLVPPASRVTQRRRTITTTSRRRSRIR